MELIVLTLQLEQLTSEIDNYLKRLFPINRSITGDGNRETLRILQEVAPIKIKEYSSGKKVYDWTIPDEWNVKDAWIKDINGNKIVDFKQSNIHLVSYSEPVDKNITFQELKTHIYIHPDLSDAIPYRTSYYKRDWGFCVTHAQYKELSMVDGLLKVHVDSGFKSEGSLTIGELLIPGESDQEILISTYICHPSLANDNLSGMVMTAFLARELLKQPKPKHSYRIIWVPETIGAITYCAMNESTMKKIQTGLVVTTVGGSGKYGYKQSYNKKNSINKSIENVFKEENIKYITYPFDIHGSDERQYSSQGFRINIASITKDKYYEYPYYHTSLDNLDFVKAEYIAESLRLHLKLLENISQESTSSPVYKNNFPNGEVMLSKHDLYPKTGGAQIPQAENYEELDLILWLLFWCDSKNSLADISEKLNINEDVLKKVAQNLIQKGVLSFE